MLDLQQNLKSWRAKASSWWPFQPPRAPLKPLQSRASAIGQLLFVATGGRVVQRSPVRYEVLAREGYQTNAVVHRCIRLVADALKATPLQVFDGEKDVSTSHPIADVLAMPNPEQVWEELIDAIVGHYYLAGDVFLEGVVLGGQLREIYALRPDQVSPEPRADGGVGAYVYEGAAGQRRFEIEPRKFQPILHLRAWNPVDHWRGLPAMAAALGAADEHNAAAQHSKALYANSARPSGALVYAPREGSDRLGDEQFERLKAELDENHTGAANAGRPLLLDGGLDWKAMGFSPKDLESGEGRAAAAREIALALGVPPLLLGLAGDNTFANYAEASLALYRQTVVPLATLIAKKLTAWLRPLAPGARIAFDFDRAPTAETERLARWERVKGADFLSIDEKRGELGFSPLADRAGEVVLVAAGQVPLAELSAGIDPEMAGALAFGRA